MPLGPNVPVGLALPVTLNVDKFGELKVWEETVLNYVTSDRTNLAPVLVSASVNINGDKLLNDVPGVRFALWRISKGVKLREAISILDSGQVPEVDPGSVRSVYASVFNDPAMIIPGHDSENRNPGPAEKKQAKDWLEEYKNV